MPCPSKKNAAKSFLYYMHMKCRRIRALGWVMQHAFLSFIFEWRSNIAIITLITIKLLSSRGLALKIARSEVSSQQFPLTGACTLLKPWNRSKKNLHWRLTDKHVPQFSTLVSYCKHFDLIKNNVRIFSVGPPYQLLVIHQQRKNISTAFFLSLKPAKTHPNWLLSSLVNTVLMIWNNSYLGSVTCCVINMIIRYKKILLCLIIPCSWISFFWLSTRFCLHINS